MQTCTGASLLSDNAAAKSFHLDPKIVSCEWMALVTGARLRRSTARACHSRAPGTHALRAL